MTYNQSLHTKLEEWISRLYSATYESINGEWDIFWKRLHEQPTLNALIQNALDTAALPDTTMSEIREAFSSGNVHSFKYTSDEHRAAFLYTALYKCISTDNGINNTITYLGSSPYSDDWGSQKENVLTTYLKPVVDYLSDNLNKENAVLYLLARYKVRTESFFRKSLLEKYQTATASYERIFEDDLRLFLFDQGIDYPFSTPNSASGRADIVGLLDTPSPLIVEIKIWDSGKSYTKNRVIEGFNQVVQYGRDYNKQVGYLVVFNCDDLEIEIESEDSGLNFPNRICFDNKTFYIVTVNLSHEKTASKRGALKKERITKDELLSSNSAAGNH